VIATSRAGGAPAPERWVPGWAAPASLVLTAAGLAVSIYLTITHFTTHVSLACSSTGVVNCEKVTTSPQSYVLGIPVAPLGVVWFVVAAALFLPAAWRAPSPAVRYARIAWMVAGVLMVVRLVYAELFQIDAICLWCTAVHVITVALFALVLVAEAQAVETASDSGAGYYPEP
jgi:uncharacterized membrane protein